MEPDLYICTFTLQPEHADAILEAWRRQGDAVNIDDALTQLIQTRIHHLIGAPYIAVKTTRKD